MEQRSKVVPILPQFGCVFDVDPVSGRITGNAGVRGRPTLGEIMATLWPNATTPMRHNRTLGAAHFEFRNSSGGLSAVFFDDSSTVARKAALVEGLGLGGIGFWPADGTSYRDQINRPLAEALWKAVERCGTLRAAVEDCGRLWKDVEGCGRPLAWHDGEARAFSRGAAKGRRQRGAGSGREGHDRINMDQRFHFSLQQQRRQGKEPSWTRACTHPSQVGQDDI